MKISNLVMILCTLILVGCTTFSAPTYVVTAQNSILIKDNLKSFKKKIKLNEFTASPSVQQEIKCRAAGPVTPTPGKTYQQYVQDAFQSELFYAGWYSNDGEIIIDGNLDYIDFESGVSKSSWDIKVSLFTKNCYSMKLEDHFEFSGSFDAVSACREVSLGLGPSVQHLISKIITHPDFRKLLCE